MTNNDETNVDLRSLNFVETINSNLICCICQSPFVDPVVLPCGHTFCTICIHQACEASSVCPIDRSAISISDIRPAVKIVCNMVNELSVECPRSEEGCDYIGQRQFIENHVKNDCLYTFAACQLEECKILVLKKDLSSHVSTCKYRSAECKMCKKKMRALELEDHHRLCPAEIIQCPHCETSRSRSEHTAHLLTCPKHPVSCKHSEFGCRWSGEREKLESEHLKNCAYEGIKDYLQLQQQKEQSLREEVQSIRKENEMLKRQQGNLSQQFQTLSDQLALLFPSQFASDPTCPEDIAQAAGLGPGDSILTETQRLKNDLETVSSNLASLELKQNVALMTETFRLQEELQSLRAICHGMRMQMHYMMMERRGASSAAAAAAASMGASEAGASSSNADGNTATAGSVAALNRMRWLDAPNGRQDTKL
ncbi:hypothetical protein BDA99DRAFT_501856 [Phascolomyces articulosus]|uniref:Uncharacterized protein n=1 Tax=Phascolomyces articulosus TaxID=60185 RepID=A0AAD5PGJ0_9FUNG|nr:hypothetical protein BDA99DRAFT_501856 [Phascolomyces articulosus]